MAARVLRGFAYVRTKAVTELVVISVIAHIVMLPNWWVGLPDVMH